MTDQAERSRGQQKAEEEAEEAAYQAERARLETLLRLQQGQEEELVGAGEEGGDGDGSAGVRYVRIKPRADPAEEEALRALLATEAGATSVPWCPPQESHRLLQLPAAFRLVQFGPYQAGLLYGMDAASAAAVWALGPQPGEHVLDLCCAPGLKLCAVADALTGLGSVTGVDVSRTRLAVARKVAVKYGVGRPNDDALAASGGGTMTCRLLCADGQSFGLGPLEEWDAGEEEGVVFDSRAYDWRGMEARGQRRMNRGTRKKELLALRAVLKPQGEGRENVSSSSTLSSSELQQTKDERESCALYDRVLVDADCTHDGSARHLSKVAALDASMCVHTAASSDVAVPPSISPQLGDIHW